MGSRVESPVGSNLILTQINLQNSILKPLSLLFCGFNIFLRKTRGLKMQTSGDPFSLPSS
jgi:hypothetical protein